MLISVLHNLSIFSILVDVSEIETYTMERVTHR